MRVLLLKDVPALGRSGTVHEVKEGYARNYLFPRGLATEATEGQLRRVAREQQVARDRQGREEQEAQALASRLGETIVEVAARAGEGGKLYGAVTAQDIAEALARKGFEISRKQIDLDEPIKAVGFYRVAVRVHPRHVAQVDVNVTSR